MLNTLSYWTKSSRFLLVFVLFGAVVASDNQSSAQPEKPQQPTIVSVPTPGPTVN